jgi:phosphate/sulfate permease
MALDWLHYLSAGTLSFARGLNDTPKIAALLLVVPVVSALAQGRLTKIPSSMPVMLAVTVSVAPIQLVPAVFSTT